MPSNNRNDTAFIDFATRCKEDFPFYCENVLRIKTDSTAGKTAISPEVQIIPFVLSRTQKKLHNILQKNNRVIVLKGRRHGLSTFVAAEMYWSIATRIGRGGMVVAHDDKTAANIFEMHQMFFTKTPEPMRPMYKIFNRKRIHFANPDPTSPVNGIDGNIMNWTADDPNLGASFALHALHFSEVSRYETVGCKIKKMMDSILPTVPNRPDCWIVMESTAEDGGSYFQDMWQNDNNYTKVFFSYISDGICRLPLESSDEYPTVLYDLNTSLYGNERQELDNILKELEMWYPELDHNERNHESMCRLAWRRHVINDQCHNDWRTFARIYPSSPEAAFASENMGVFAQAILLDDKEILNDDPPFRTNKDFNYHVAESKGFDWHRYAFDIRPHGPMEVFEEPMPNVRYVIGADPSYGIDQSDSSAAVVLRLPDLVEVATWCAPISPTEFAELLYALGLTYNKALLGVESNGVGYSTQRDLLMKLRYPKLYLKRKHNLKPGVETTEEFGWWTDKNSKEAMIADLRDAINHREICINSMRTLEQLETFRQLPDGKLGAPSGKHDDLVIALAISLQMANISPKYLGARREKNDYGTIGWWARQGQYGQSYKNVTQPRSTTVNYN